MAWFTGLEIEMQVALVSACGIIVVAVINGVFLLLSKNKNSNGCNTTTTSINQNTKGRNNTIIGIQNNTKEKDD